MLRHPAIHLFTWALLGAIACGDDDEAAGGGGSGATSAVTSSGSTASSTSASTTVGSNSTTSGSGGEGGSGGQGGGGGQGGSGAQGGGGAGGEGVGASGGGGSGGSGGTGGQGSGAGDQGGGGSGGDGGAGSGPPVSCDVCGNPTDLGNVANSQIDELSGLAASRRHAGVLFGNDDSGEDPVIFAFTLAGEDRGTYPLQGATAVDWEDLAAGPCADGEPECLYVADFGDNDEIRDDLVLYRVREPATVAPGLQAALPVEAFPFSYPDGPHNAEALVVHPATGVVTIITKGNSPALYELVPPLQAGMVATRIGDYENPITIVTGADIDPFGSTIAVRTYLGVFLYPIAPGASAASALLTPYCLAPSAFELQGESVAWLTEGRAYVTVSEGAGAELHRVGCP